MALRFPVDLRQRLASSLLITAMLIYPIPDAIAKHLTHTLSPVFVSWCRFAASAAVALLVAVYRGRIDLIPRGMVAIHSARALFLVASMTLYFVAISAIPLADALAAFFVAPILASLGASLILGERLSRRKLVGVALGFAGTLAIVQPDTGATSGIGFALASGAIYAGFLITTRIAAQSCAPLTTLLFQFSVGTSVLLPFAYREIALLDYSTAAWVLSMGMLSVVAHFLAVYAFRFAEASALSPLIYFEIIGNVLFGYIFFGDFPPASTWIGIALIVVAGISVTK